MQPKNESKTSTVHEELAQKVCNPSKADVQQPLDGKSIESNMQQLNGWELQDGALAKTITFQNYYETLAFVNAVAWIAHREDHHPDITFSYKICRVVFTTHSAKGITDNDFIAAAKVDRLFS